MDVFGIDRAVLHDYCKKYSECYKNEQVCKEKLENLNAVDITDFDEIVKLDLEYIDNWSVGLDIKILFMTVVTVLFRRGAV